MPRGWQPGFPSGRAAARSRARALVAAIPLLLCVMLVERVGAQVPDTVRVSYAVTSRWETGFTAELTIRNDAAWAIPDWQFSFRFAPQITRIWNARIVSRRGDEYVIGPVEADWEDGGLAPGAAVTIGFVASGPATAAPANAHLNEAPVRFNATSPAPRPDTPAIVPASDWPAAAFAPYVDATAWPPFDLVAAADQLGVRYTRLGFVVAQSATQGVPSWGGAYSATSSYRLREINALRLRGGDVAIVFGGAVGIELAATTESAAELAATYESVIDAYGARVVDFDLEGVWLADRASIQRRAAALGILQRSMAAAGRPLELWFTLPVMPTGLTPDGLQVLRASLDQGVDIRGVNVMVMNYGAAVAPVPAGRMGSYAIEAARNLHEQLRTLYAASDTPKGASELWQMIGITPMIGRNDVAAEVFRQSDAGRLLDFASQKRVGLLSFWSLNRDRPCERPEAAPSPTCSGIPQEPYEFTRMFRRFEASRD